MIQSYKLGGENLEETVKAYILHCSYLLYEVLLNTRNEHKQCFNIKGSC